MAAGRKYATLVLLLLAALHFSHAAGIEWYRTAQGTSDRLTKQPNITFGGDFPSSATIAVNRSVLQPLMGGAPLVLSLRFTQVGDLPIHLGIRRSLHGLCILRLLQAQLHAPSSSAGHVLLRVWPQVQHGPAAHRLM